jgi:aspartate carbamoyltransferase catalytic subunit
MGGSAMSYHKPSNGNLKDDIMVMSSVSDVIVLSHSKKGAARAASLYSRVPVINAGDGGRAYPVKTLADFSTVWIEKNHVSNMKIGFLGDFSNNALVRNLLQCLSLYNGNEFYFISVNGAALPEEIITVLNKREKEYFVFDNLFDAIPELDVLYMTEVTKECFENEKCFEERKHNFILNEKMLLTAKEDLVILHQFPRGVELDASVDEDDRATYVSALDRYVDACCASVLKTVTGKAGRYIKPDFEEATHDAFCGKADCITSDEKYLPALFYELADGKLICKYCGQELKMDE